MCVALFLTPFQGCPLTLLIHGLRRGLKSRAAPRLHVQGEIQGVPWGSAA